MMTTAYDPRLHHQGRGRVRRLPPLLKAAVAVAVLVTIGVVINDRLSLKHPPACLFSCGPNVGPSGPREHTFTSTTFGFSFDYPSYWSPASASGDVVANFVATDSNGSLLSDFQVSAGTGNLQPSDLITAKAQSISRAIQQLESTGGMPGAQIGFSPGQGEFYQGDLVYTSGAQQPVEVAILAVQRNGEWVVVTAVSAYDSRKRAIANRDFDDTLIRWRCSR
jgi:hypothetical protein